MQEINYSIIIPHKNCIDLLKRCLDSIPEREDLEIIVVDDNSNVEQDKFPYRDRPGLKYIFLNAEQSNYAGHARNEGMKVARGKWFLFADADDYYTENFPEFLERYKNDDIHDVLYMSANVVDEKGNITEFKINRYIKNYQNARLYSEKILKFGVWTPWTRMVKSEMILKHGLIFEESPTGNDLYFGILSSSYASNIICETNIIYNYYRPSTRSITDSYYTISTLESRMRQTIKMNEIYKRVHYIYRFSLILSYRIPNYIVDKKNIKQYRTIRKSVFRNYQQNIIIDLYYALISILGSLFKHI